MMDMNKAYKANEHEVNIENKKLLMVKSTKKLNIREGENDPTHRKAEKKKGKGAKKAKKISWENVMYTPKKAVSGQWKTPLGDGNSGQ